MPDISYIDYERVPLKSGKLGKRLKMILVYYSPINKCDICGKYGGIRKVTNRSDVYGWNRLSDKDYLTPSKDMLCIGCWNKVRAIVKKECELKQSRRLINKIEREIRNELKNKSN